MPTDTVALPEGTVTVLSTDLVGSTLLNQRLGDEAATALERARSVPSITAATAAPSPGSIRRPSSSPHTSK
jgi:hypothetical protein